MPQRFPSILESALARLLSTWIRPDVLPHQPATLLDPSRPVLYVLEVGGIADRTALALVSRAAQLPSPGEPLRYGDANERTSVDVLHRRRKGSLGFGRRHASASPRLQRLVAARLRGGHQATCEDGTTPPLPDDLQIVPVAVYWGRAPGKDSSFLRLLFTENWALGGRVAKLVTTLIHGRNTLVQLSEPLSLDALLHSDRTIAAPNPERLSRKLSRILRVHFRRRRIATLGPDRSHRRTLLMQVLGDDAVRHAVSHEIATTKKSRDRVQRVAEGYAREIAADVSYATIRVLDRLLTRLWTELYDGIELSGIERLRQVADGREIVYVPCHRSHIDYLLLSYILVKEGFSLPHVAAGVNLNLPFVGGILRRGGAFFLRRSFAGNPLYAAVFSSYLEEIIQRGNAIEYFIEGGRSRSGRLLPAKGGMLAMTAQAYLRQPVTPVVFVPVYFGYERLLEGGAFTSELAGGKKEKESLFGLFGSLKRLREDYGRVHVGIGEPIALDPLLDRHRPTWRDEPTGTERPEWLKPMVRELGDTILGRINAAASVTPVALLATAMLATSRGALGRGELVRQIEVYGSILRITYADTLVVIPALDEGRADTFIDHGKQLGYLETRTDPIGELVLLRAGQAAPLTYFRNNILHLLTLPALLAAAFSSEASRSDAQLQTLVQISLPFLHGELCMPADPGAGAIVKALAALEAEGLIKRQQTRWRRAQTGSPEAVSLLRLADVVRPALERFYLCSALLIQTDAPIAREQLELRCASSAERLATTEGRNVHDLHDKHLLKRFLDQMIALDYVIQSDGRLQPTERLARLEGEARRVLDDRIRHAILRATLGCSQQHNAVCSPDKDSDGTLPAV